MKPTRYATMLTALAAPLSAAVACEVCQANQPKLISRFTHGYGPTGPADYIAPGLMLLVMLYSALRAAQCFRKSADRPHQTAKRSILATPTR